MNWVEALPTIDSLMLSLEKPLQEEPRTILARSQVTQTLLESPEEMLEIFKADELREEQEEEGLLHLSYLAEVESPEEEILRKKEAKDKHNVPKKKEFKGVSAELLSNKELRAKLQEEVEKEPVPWSDVPQYFKDYIVDEVVIVMPQAVRPSQVENQPSTDGVYDGPARTREIDLAHEGETRKPVHIGEHLTQEESEELKQLLVEFKDCFA